MFRKLAFVVCCLLLQSAGSAAPASVDLRTGGLQLAVTDLEQPAGTTPLTVTRWLDAPTAKPGLLGKRWRANWDYTKQPAAFKITRDSQGRLTRVEGPFGSFLRFYHGADGRLARVETSNGEVAAYSYTNGELSAVETTRRPTQRYQYDPSGALARVEDPAMGTTEYLRDVFGRVVRIRTAAGTVTTYEYDDKARATRRTSPIGAVTSMQWSADGRSETITDALGNKNVLERDAAGRLARTVGPAGQETRFSYDTNGRPVSAENVGCCVTLTEYDGESNRPKSVRVGDAPVASMEYDAAGRLTALKSGTEILAGLTYTQDGLVAEAKGSRARRFTYDAAGRVASVTDSLGRVTRSEYDARGDLVRRINAGGGVTRYEYDRSHRVISTIDPAGGQTRFEYDAAGRLLRSIDRLGRATTYQYDEAGRRVAVTDSAGQTTRYTYQSHPAELQVTGPDGLVLTTRYNVTGQVAEQVDVFGRSTKYSYDANGRVIAEQPPLGPTISFRYDSGGRLVADGQATYTYDSTGRLAAKTDLGGAAERYGYDGAGRLASLTDPLGHVTRYQFDSAGHLLQQVTPSGETAQFAYDPEGHATAVGPIKLGYDALGNLAEIAMSGAGPLRHVYDQAGRRVSTSDGAGHTIRYACDAGGRLASKTLPDGTSVKYQYSALGQLLRVDDGKFPIGYSYDGSHLSAVTYDALKKTIRFATDRFGRRTQLVTTDGQTLRYQYDSQNRLASITLPRGGALSFAHDDHNRLQTVRYPNGVNGAWEYDAAGRVQALAYRDSAGKTLASWRYRHDAAGNPVSIERSHASTRQLAYDADDRLVQDGPLTFKYGAGGNRADCKFDNAGRLIEAAGQPIAQDASGNVTSRGGTAFEFDAQGRLVRAGSVKFGYAATSERISREDSAGLTWYVHDGMHLLEELDRAGRRVALYVHGPGTDRPLAMVRDGQTYFYHADPLGTVALLTDAQGRVVATYETDAFGNVTAQTGAVKNPFIFAGREYEPAAKIYYFRARYYDPALGRFLSPDPLPPSVRDAGSLNRYVYARNAPLRWADPMGMADEVSNPTLYFPSTREDPVNAIDIREIFNETPPPVSSQSGGTPQSEINQAVLSEAAEIISKGNRIGLHNLTPEQRASYYEAWNVVEANHTRAVLSTVEVGAGGAPLPEMQFAPDHFNSFEPLPDLPPAEAVPSAPAPPRAPGGPASPPAAEPWQLAETVDSPRPGLATTVDAPAPPRPAPTPAPPPKTSSPLTQGVGSFQQGETFWSTEPGRIGRAFGSTGAAAGLGGAIGGANAYAACIERGGSQSECAKWGAVGAAGGAAMGAGSAAAVGYLVSQGVIAAGTAAAIGTVGAAAGAIGGGYWIARGGQEALAQFNDRGTQQQAAQNLAAMQNALANTPKGGEVLGQLRAQLALLNAEVDKAKTLGGDLSRSLESIGQQTKAIQAATAELEKLNDDPDANAAGNACGEAEKRLNETTKACSAKANETVNLIEKAGEWPQARENLVKAGNALVDAARNLHNAKAFMLTLKKSITTTENLYQQAQATQKKAQDLINSTTLLGAVNLWQQYAAQRDAVAQFQKIVVRQVNNIAAVLPAGALKDEALALAGQAEFVSLPSEPDVEAVRSQLLKERTFQASVAGTFDHALDNLLLNAAACEGIGPTLDKMNPLIEDAGIDLAAAVFVLSSRLEKVKTQLNETQQKQKDVADLQSKATERDKAIADKKAQHTVALKAGTLSAADAEKSRQALQQLATLEAKEQDLKKSLSKDSQDLAKQQQNLTEEQGVLGVTMEKAKEAAAGGAPP